MKKTNLTKIMKIHFALTAALLLCVIVLSIVLFTFIETQEIMNSDIAEKIFELDAK